MRKFALAGMLSLLLFMTVQAVSAYTVEGFGAIEGLYTGFLQIGLPIAAIIFVGVLAFKLMPGAKAFLGGLFGG